MAFACPLSELVTGAGPVTIVAMLPISLSMILVSLPRIISEVSDAVRAYRAGNVPQAVEDLTQAAEDSASKAAALPCCSLRYRAVTHPIPEMLLPLRV